jgi:hypothetical protein
MDFGRLIRGAGLALIFCCAMGSPGGAPLAATFPEFVDPNPASGNQFGISVTPLSTGNVVITSPFDDAGGPDFGAVYLFNGATGDLISTLRGSTTSDFSTVFVTPLSNGNYLLLCRSWNNGGAVDAGAVTFGSGTTGVSGVVSAANSLVGTTANDFASTSVTALSNGNYVVRSPTWDSGGLVNVGAVTWCNGTTGRTGVISAANSLVGTTANDHVGLDGVTGLLSGNYLVASRVWDNGAIVNAGAVTWCNGTTGRTGVISAANSLVGSTASDEVGGHGVTELLNGNYVIRNASWDNGLSGDVIINAGAVTWGSGATGVSGAISAANSLVGTSVNDNIGSNFVYALSNGNYVVVSQNWDNGAISNVGAVTWGSGTTGVTGAVSAANSLIGSTANDQVGGFGMTALTGGNYVVNSPNWDNGAVVNAGAATWRSGTTGVGAVVSASNSLVGTNANDNVSSGGVTALGTGNYVVCSPAWYGTDVGAATFGNGTTGSMGAVSTANSLVGSTTGDQVGAGVNALLNGNYVVGSPLWDNGAIVNAGAATWGNGTTGMTGVVTTANSLVGSTTSESVGGRVTALSNGNYVVTSGGWDNGAVTDVGAVTWGNGTTGVSGAISAANSLVGSKANDRVGLVDDLGNFDNGVTALTNGNYVVASSEWDNGGLVEAGAVTWGNGSAGVTGVVSAANSLIGSTISDRVGGTSVTPLANGNYVVCSEWWEDGGGGVVNAGAATWGDGTTGVTGLVSAANSLVGESGSSGLLSLVVDIVNDTFIARFLTDGGGRVRVGPRDFSPMIVSALDIPSDQGGWVRLIFNRSSQDVVASSAIAMYGIWRHVPGTIPAGTGEANLSAAPDSRLDPRAKEDLRAALPSGLDVREAGGRLYVVGPTAGPTIATVFPPGTWELVASVGAIQQAQYVVATPTVSNAAPNDFVVSAHTITPALWFVSEPMTGQSVDNLAPAQPTQLTGSYSGGQTNIQWAANTETDLGSYRVYRGTSADFTPGAGNQIATVTSPSHADVGPAGGYYKVSAVDVNGNESGFALLTPEQTTEVEGEGSVAFALEGVWPNPSHGNGLHVAFALPSRAAGRLELLDVSGRRLLAHDVGSLAAGRHRVNLAAGRKIASGVYWVRLTQGPNQRTTRVAVIE